MAVREEFPVNPAYPANILGHLPTPMDTDANMHIEKGGESLESTVSDNKKFREILHEAHN